jgi:hypothetical protein
MLAHHFEKDEPDKINQEGNLYVKPPLVLNDG